MRDIDSNAAFPIRSSSRSDLAFADIAGLFDHDLNIRPLDQFEPALRAAISGITTQ